MSYISSSDITDSVARDFVSNSDTRVTTWLDRTDDMLEALAISLGVQIDSIYTPLNYYVKEFCIAYFCFLAFQDAYGENEVEDDANDIYKLKLQYYSERVSFLQSKISREMMMNAIANLTNTQIVSAGVLYRS